MSALLSQDVCRQLGLEPNDERYTLAETKAFALEQLGLKKYTLDVAGCPESHLAPRWFGLQLDGSFVDGLLKPWSGDSWGNIPFSKCEAWVEKAWWEWSRGRLRSITLLLPNDKTEQKFWQRLVAERRDRRGSPLRTREIPKRTQFSAPGLNGRPIPGRDIRRPRGSAFFGCYLLMWHRRFLRGAP